MRDRSLRRATLSVAIGERMALRLSSLGVPQERIRVVSNWADGELVRPIDPAANPLRSKWGLDHAFVVGYSGNLGRAHDIQTTLDAIEEIERKPASGGEAPPSLPVIWLFIGGGVQHGRFRRELEARKLSSVRFQPYQPRDLLTQSLSVPDVHLVTLRPSLEGLVVPSKYYGVAAAGRPTIFIGDGDGEIARLLRRHDCGLVVPEGDGRKLASSVLELAARPQIRAAMGARARDAFARHYDKPIAVAHWHAILQKIEGGGRGPASSGRD
jgi:glycosyltransferase involved in cell wall biosynthesis